ncbi:MAG: hypothetical protein ACJA1Z_002943 [Patiriisocius sp.]|jgi:hypothetical protein
MVLSTKLLIVYENMLSNPRFYQKKYKKLMKKLVLPYLTNKRQLVEAKAEGLIETAYERLLPQLQSLPNRDYDLTALAATTSLKIILTEDVEVSLPYVNFKSKFLNNELTVSLTSVEDRRDLIKYLGILTSSARSITICDNYFASSWEHTCSLFQSVLPRHKLEIEFVETPDSIQVIKNSVKMTQDYVVDIYCDWTIKESNSYQGAHDRYLLIDSPEGKVEVMLSSGFGHIWHPNPKEITCVIRQI